MNYKKTGKLLGKIIFPAAVFILSFEPAIGQVIVIASDAGASTVKHGFFSDFSAVPACISNIAPTFERIGPYSCFMDYSAVSKFTSVLILFNRRTWKRI